MMERRIGLAALDVEKYSKIGTQDLQTGQLDQALEAFKYAYKRSHELDDGFTERACAFNLGAAYIAMGQHKQGLETLRKAIPPENRQEGKSNGDLYFNFGLGYEGLRNYEDAARHYTKALEEYRSEGEDSEMEIETLEKLAQIYSLTKNVFAVDVFSQLVQLYERMNNPANFLKHMKALFEKANHLNQDGRKEDAEKAADDCMSIAEKCGDNSEVGNILNDLGLVYTQLQKYDRALTCFEQALPMIRSKQVDKKQEAVLLQNLGATYNFLGDYQRAIGFHESAIKLYAELKNRNCQGQCFANLAFAFCQLKDLEAAGEAFLHAYQAAKDTGDKKTQWQVSEGLGAVAFNKGQINKAINYFKQALSILSTSEPNAIAQNRIVGKLTHALQVQVAIPVGIDPSQQIRKHPHQKDEKVAVDKAKIIAANKADSEDEGVKIKYGKGKRFIRVNRHGSSKRFHKVARGISTPSLTGTSSFTLQKSMLSPSEDSISERAGTSDESEESNIEEVKMEYLRRVGLGAKRKVIEEKKEESEETESEDSEESGEEEETESVEEEETETEDEEGTEIEEEKEEKGDVKEKHENEDDAMDRKAVKDEMRKIFQNEDGGKQKQQTKVEEENTDKESESDDEETAVKRPFSPKVKVEEASKKDSDSESSSDSESEPPPVPTQSPLPTAALVRTYDDPVTRQKGSEAKNRRTKYADIDFQSPVGTSGMTSDMRNPDPYLHDHPNYFDSESEEDIKSRLENGKDKQITDMTDENLALSPAMIPSRAMMMHRQRRSSRKGLHTKNSNLSRQNSFSLDAYLQSHAYRESIDGYASGSRFNKMDTVISEQDDNDPVYQSIRTGDRTQTDDDQQQPDFSKFENLPRGENDHKPRDEQERLLNEVHQRYRQRQSEAPPLPDRRIDQKPSKTCIVM